MGSGVGEGKAESGVADDDTSRRACLRSEGSGCAVQMEDGNPDVRMAF